jgi:hypothetical protein
MGKKTGTGSLWQDLSRAFHTPESADSLTWEQYFQLLEQLNGYFVTASSEEAQQAYKSLQTLHVVPTMDESRPRAWKLPKEAYWCNHANQSINALLTEKKALMASSAADWIQRCESFHAALMFAGLRTSILQIEPFPNDPESFSLPCGQRIRNLKNVLTAIGSSAGSKPEASATLQQQASTATLVQLNQLLTVEPSLFNYSEKSSTGAISVKEHPQLRLLREIRWLNIKGEMQPLDLQSVNKAGMSEAHRAIWEKILKSVSPNIDETDAAQRGVKVDLAAEQIQRRRLEIEEAAIAAILIEEPELQRTPPNNEGFDLFTTNDEKFVEVKSLLGAWTTRNTAKLTWPQMRMAYKAQDKYWIYVVEFAEDNARRNINRIHHPFSHNMRFSFSPDVWRAGIGDDSSK